MPRSDMRRFAAALALLSAGIAPGGALAQISPGAAPARLVEMIEADGHGSKIVLNVEFTCSMRYLAHFPAREGRRVTLELQPLADCGVRPFSRILSEIPPLTGDARDIASARLDSNAPGQVTLTIELGRTERFVVAQGLDARGLRIELTRPSKSVARVVVGGVSSHAQFLAINLDSQLQPFTPAAVRAAESQVHVPVFVSSTVVDGRKWYRLRAGPFASRRDAERVLRAALARYPLAWLALGDDSRTTSLETSVAGGSPPPVQQMGSDPPLDRRTLARLLSRARAALRAKDFATAIRLLTRLQRQPEFPGRAQAQELLGLARERSGQLAQAVAEYEEYLRRYPNGDAAERVAARLRILRAATLPGGRGPGASAAVKKRWELSGGVAQMFRYDSSRIDAGSQPTTVAGSSAPGQTTTADSLYTDVDMLARHRGESVDWTTDLSAGYARGFGTGTLPGSTRVSLASVEWRDRAHGVLARAGRQVRNDDGILGTFDGLFVSYQVRPAWALDAAAGYPVVLTTDAPRTQRRFESLALALTPPGSRWDGSVFATMQTFYGLHDRRAGGFEFRYLAPRASLVGLADYDVSFHSLNAAMLLGTVQLPRRWSVSLDAERHNSPVLTAENALIGQPFTSILALEQTYTPAQIYQLARDRTPITDTLSLSVTRPLGERFAFTGIASADRTGATIASGGVQAQPTTGIETTYQAQLYGTSLWTSGDFHVVTLTYAQTEIGKLDAVDLSSRFPLGGAWRMGPRLSLARTALRSDGSTELTAAPSVLIDYQRGLGLVQLELGGEIGRRSVSLQSQKTQRYFVSLAYRIGFAP